MSQPVETHVSEAQIAVHWKEEEYFDFFLNFILFSNNLENLKL